MKSVSPMVAYLFLAAFFGAAIGVLANTVALPTLVTLGLIFLGIGIPTMLGLRADSKRRGIPTRF